MVSWPTDIIILLHAVAWVTGCFSRLLWNQDVAQPQMSGDVVYSPRARLALDKSVQRTLHNNKYSRTNFCSPRIYDKEKKQKNSKKAVKSGSSLWHCCREPGRREYISVLSGCQNRHGLPLPSSPLPLAGDNQHNQ